MKKLFVLLFALVTLVAACELTIANPYHVTYEVTGTGRAYVQIIEEYGAIAHTDIGLVTLPWSKTVYPKSVMPFTFVSATAEIVGTAIAVHTWVRDMDCGEVGGQGQVYQAINWQY